MSIDLLSAAASRWASQDRSGGGVCVNAIEEIDELHAMILN